MKLSDLSWCISLEEKGRQSELSLHPAVHRGHHGPSWTPCRFDFTTQTDASDGSPCTRRARLATFLTIKRPTKTHGLH